MYRQGIEVKRDTNAGVLFEYPSSLAVVEEIFPGASEKVAYPHDEDYLVHVNHQGTDIACIAGHGASVAACMAERLRVYGAQTLIRIGTCGALSKEVQLWEPIITTACFSDEGTSRHYLPEGFPILPNQKLNRALRKKFEKKGIVPQEGITITTDGRWRENSILLKKLHELGVISIEMETAAILAVAHYRKLFGAAINIATDLPVDEDTGLDFKGVPDRENYDRNMDESLRRIIPVVFDTIAAFQKVIAGTSI